MMNVRAYLYDAFTDRPFGGNVAGVVLDASVLDAKTMQRIAAELHAPTTGFVVGQEPGSPPTFDVRYFTPRQEIDLCGHVTVALFTALVAEGRCQAQPEGIRAHQRTLAGELPVLLYSGEDGEVTVEMEQRPAYFEPPSVKRRAVQEMLGDVPLHSSLPVEIASTGLRHLMVPFPRIGELARLDPDFGALARLSHTLKVDTVCTFALSPEVTTRVRVRDFCSSIGADEEAASGTTSGALACYLAKHGVISPDQSGEMRVQVEQGVEMGRPSWIEARLTQVDATVQRVCVRGRAIEVLKGELHCYHNACFK
jgi:PhzF family phenazine biosynthesis protein